MPPELPRSQELKTNSEMSELEDGFSISIETNKGKPVGCVTVYIKSGTQAKISMLEIYEVYRNQGKGKELAIAAIEELKRRGIQTVGIEAVQGSIQFWRKVRAGVSGIELILDNRS